MKNQRGFSVVEWCMVVTLVGIIALVLIPTLATSFYQRRFNEAYGFQAPAGGFSTDQKLIVRPLVDKRLAELEAQDQAAIAAYYALKNLPAASTPQEVQERLNTLAVALQRCKITRKQCEHARTAAALFLDKTHQ